MASRLGLPRPSSFDVLHVPTLRARYLMREADHASYIFSRFLFLGVIDQDLGGYLRVLFVTNENTGSIFVAVFPKLQSGSARRSCKETKEL